MVCYEGMYSIYNATTNATTCVSICPKAYYPHGQTSQCVACYQDDCAQCTYTDAAGYQCLRCVSPTYLVVGMGVCASACLDGYYATLTYENNTTTNMSAVP